MFYLRGLLAYKGHNWVTAACAFTNYNARNDILVIFYFTVKNESCEHKK